MLGRSTTLSLNPHLAYVPSLLSINLHAAMIFIPPHWTGLGAERYGYNAGRSRMYQNMLVLLQMCKES
jgi:hypothetical protein